AWITPAGAVNASAALNFFGGWPSIWYSNDPSARHSPGACCTAVRLDWLLPSSAVPIAVSPGVVSAMTVTRSPLRDITLLCGDHKETRKRGATRATDLIMIPLLEPRSMPTARRAHVACGQAGEPA